MTIYLTALGRTKPMLADQPAPLNPLALATVSPWLRAVARLFRLPVPS
jgi:hypothetical protein